MAPCEKCGGKRFEVSAVCTAKNTISLCDDSDDFDIEDTEYGDCEWDDDSTVACLKCGHEILYTDWKEDEDGWNTAIRLAANSHGA